MVESYVWGVLDNDFLETTVVYVVLPGTSINDQKITSTSNSDRIHAVFLPNILHHYGIKSAALK